MKNHLLFDSMKKNFISILNKKSSNQVNEDDLFIDYSDSLNDIFNKYFSLLEEQEKLLSVAREKNDELEMQSALLKLRTHAMSLASFFEAIVEDAEITLRLDTWHEIPEDYQGNK